VKITGLKAGVNENAAAVTAGEVKESCGETVKRYPRDLAIAIQVLWFE